MLLSVGFLIPLLRAQVSVRDLKALEGAWECTGPGNSVAGIFFTAYTQSRHFSGKGGREEIKSQAVNIRVYQRQAATERSGYFSPDPGGPAVLEGEHLTIHFKDPADIPPFDLDVVFDRASEQWTGSWSLCEKSQQVILGRPRPREGASPNVFVGNWDGGANGAVFIRQGYDGSLTAWLDRTLVQADKRNGEWLKVISASQTTIMLETTNPWGVKYCYTGTLSSDGKTMSGNWGGGTGGTLNAPTLFRLIGRP